jgi:S1-C subfamily serine protease
VIVDARHGLVIANRHVVEHADEITVTLTDGRRLRARDVGADPETDVAVIMVTADGLIALPLGQSRVCWPRDGVACQLSKSLASYWARRY